MPKLTGRGRVVALALLAGLVGCKGERTLEAGFFVEGQFQPLSDGAELPVVVGVQTGTWSMPAIRCRGCAEDGFISAEARLETGELLGSIRLRVRMMVLEDGTRQLDYIPIPIGNDPGGPSAEQAYQQRGFLALSYEDGGEEQLRTTLQVIFVDGD